MKNGLRSITSMIDDVLRISPARIAWHGLIAVLILLGVTFLAVAANLALARTMPEEWAAAVVGGGAILLGVVVLLGLRLTGRKATGPARKAPGRRDLSPETVAALIRAINASPTRATAFAAIAGVVAGAAPGLFKETAEFFED
jgi:cobalamin biosynthesis protein CobD/CbiB